MRYRKKGYFGLLSYFNNLTGVEYFSKQVITSAYKYKTVSEIEQLMIRFYLSPFDYQKILSNESVLKNRTTDEILKILYYRFETINGSELEIFDEIITNDVIEENKSFNEIEQMMDFFNKYDAYYIKEILLNSDLLLTRSIDELEELIKWNCHDQIRSIFKKGLINQVVINKFNNEKLIRLVNLINENPNYEKIVNELITSSNFYEYNSIDEIEWIFKKLNSSNHGKVLEELALSARINGECDLDTLSEIIDTISHSIYYINVLMGNYTFNRQNNPFSKYTGNTILEIIKRIINHECSDDLFNLFDDICLDNYSKEDLSKLMMLYIENDFDENVLKIVTNPLLSIKTPEEIKQLITLASKYLYSERIMGYLEDEDIISIENIDELINVIEYRLKHTHVVKEIETEENIKEYIEYLKEIYGNKEFTIEEKCTLTKNIQDQ